MILSFRAKTFLRDQNEQEYGCHNNNDVIRPVWLHEHSHNVETRCFCLLFLPFFPFFGLHCLFGMASALISNVLHNYVLSLVRRWMGNSDFKLEVAAPFFNFQSHKFNLTFTVESFSNPRLLTADHIDKKLFLASNEELSAKFFRRKEDLFKGFGEPESCADRLPGGIKSFGVSFLI